MVIYVTDLSQFPAARLEAPVVVPERPFRVSGPFRTPNLVSAFVPLS